MIEERLLSFWSLEAGEQGIGNATLLYKTLPRKHCTTEVQQL
jgi:hypothetical protein